MHREHRYATASRLRPPIDGWHWLRLHFLTKRFERTGGSRKTHLSAGFMPSLWCYASMERLWLVYPHFLYVLSNPAHSVHEATNQR